MIIESEKRLRTQKKKNKGRGYEGYMEVVKSVGI